MMNSFSPGLIKPSSRRAISSIAAGSSFSLRASSRSRAFSLRARISVCCSARCSSRFFMIWTSPLSPTSASTTSTPPRNTSRYCTARRRRRRRVVPLASAAVPPFFTVLIVGEYRVSGQKYRYPKSLASTSAKYQRPPKSTSEIVSSSAEVVLVLTTIGADADAAVLARTLIEERLAACVNIGAPMTSVYRWKGAIEVDREQQLVIKTTGDRLVALESRLRALHPYELPEFVVLSASGGSTAYLEWVRASVD